MIRAPATSPKLQSLNPDRSHTVGKVLLPQMSFVLGFVMPKVYSDAVSYESTFYFILKYHELSIFLPFTEGNPPNIVDSKQQ